MEAFEASGQWWLPERPENVVSGTLAVAENGRAELRLIGSLRSFFEGGESVTKDGTTTTTFTEKSMRAAGVYPRILGIADGKSYTLDDCFQTNWKHNLFGGGVGAETVHVHQVFRGVHFDEGEELEFVSLVVNMDWFAYWVGLGGISESMEFKQEDGGVQPIEHVLTIKPVPTEEFAGMDGATLKIGQTYGLTGDNITEKRVWQDFYLVVEFPTAVPLSKLLEQAGLVQHLVAMGTGKVPAFSKVSVRHSDLVRTIGSKDHWIPIEMFAQWQVANRQTPKYLSSDAMPFSLPQLGGASGISNWVTAAWPHMAAVSRVMTTRYEASPYVGDSFLNCAAALEGYDRTKHGDDQNYVDRVKRCIAHAGAEFEDLVGDVDAWARAMKNKRNDVAHHNVGVESASTEQFLLTRSAYWLFVLCLLRDAGAPDEVFQNITQHGAFTSLKRQLEDLNLS